LPACGQTNAGGKGRGGNPKRLFKIVLPRGRGRERKENYHMAKAAALSLAITITTGTSDRGGKKGKGGGRANPPNRSFCIKMDPVRATKEKKRRGEGEKACRPSANNACFPNGPAIFSKRGGRDGGRRKERRSGPGTLCILLAIISVNRPVLVRDI